MKHPTITLQITLSHQCVVTGLVLWGEPAPDCVRWLRLSKNFSYTVMWQNWEQQYKLWAESVFPYICKGNPLQTVCKIIHTHIVLQLLHLPPSYADAQTFTHSHLCSLRQPGLPAEDSRPLLDQRHTHSSFPRLPLVHLSSASALCHPISVSLCVCVRLF